jgi:hypothetical protein
MLKKKKYNQAKKKHKKNTKKQSNNSFKLEDSHIYTFMMEALYS